MDIHTIPLFIGIDPSIVDTIIAQAKKESYPSKAIIFTQGDAPNGKAYIIESGKVEVLIEGERRKVLGEGDIFGEIALLNEDARTATIQVLEDVSLIILSYDNMMQMIENDQNFINKEVIHRIEENYKSQYNFSREIL